MSDRDNGDNTSASGPGDQALRGDPPALPGVPLGLLIVGAIGWLLSAVAIIALPWPMPGAQPTIFGALLRRLIVSIPDEDAFSSLTRHLVDLLPFVALLLIPVFLVFAAGRRQSRGAVNGLAVAGALGMLYTLSMALYVGGSCAAIGFVIVLISGVIGTSAWMKGPVDRPEAPHSTPMTDNERASEYIIDTNKIEIESEIYSEGGTGNEL